LLKPSRKAAVLCTNVQINHLHSNRAVPGPLGSSQHTSSLDHVNNLGKGTWKERQKQRRRERDGEMVTGGTVEKGFDL